MWNTEGYHDVPPHALLDDRVDVNKRCAVVKCRKASGPNDRVKFGLSFLLNFGEVDHCKEEGDDVGERLRIRDEPVTLTDKHAKPEKLRLTVSAPAVRG